MQKLFIINKLSLLLLTTGCTTLQPSDHNLYTLNYAINHSAKYVKDTKHHLKTPTELYTSKEGDCKDFAFAKYSLLQSKGYNNLTFILIPNPKDRDNSHVVLKVNNTILDNKTDSIYPASEVNGITLSYYIFYRVANKVAYSD